MFYWGIIGTGRIARKFARELQLVPNTKLIAVAGSDLARAKAFAAEFGADFAYATHDEIVGTPNLDAVYVGTTNDHHCADALLCLNHKIPVLCEKPFAMNSTEVQQMLEAAQRNNTFLMEALWTRFLPSIKKIKELIEADTIGKIKTIRADFGFNASKAAPLSRVFVPELGGGSLVDVGIYPMFLAQLFLGKPIAVKATATIGDTGVDEDCSMLFEYGTGQLAVLYSSIACKTPTEAFINGEKGYIHILPRFHGVNGGFTLAIYDGSHDGAKTHYNFDWWGDGFTYQIQEVMDCIKAGKKQSDLMSHAFSLALMETLDWVGAEIKRN